VFPSGPLRAPLAPQLARTDGIIVVGAGQAADGVAAAVAAKGGLVLRAAPVPDERAVAALRGHRVLAFAGIGDPARFFATLRAADIEVAAERTFPDHHPYRKQDVAQLVTDAKRDGLRLVTTAKDMVRLRMVADAALCDQISVLPVTLQVDDIAALRALLLAAVRRT
jgi:tetraacyldisaccharide 4'-kinase